MLKGVVVLRNDIIGGNDYVFAKAESLLGDFGTSVAKVAAICASGDHPENEYSIVNIHDGIIFINDFPIAKLLKKEGSNYICYANDGCSPHRLVFLGDESTVDGFESVCMAPREVVEKYVGLGYIPYHYISTVCRGDDSSVTIHATNLFMYGYPVELYKVSEGVEVFDDYFRMITQQDKRCRQYGTYVTRTTTRVYGV